MKKFLVFGLIAGAGALMAGCSKDEAKSDFGQNAIEFGTYLGRDAQTRGAELTTATLQNMGVYASYTGQDNFGAQTPNFMFNQKVTKGTTEWEYNPLKYWPTTVGDKISFFAYAPYADETVVKEKSENTATGAPTLTVTLPSDLTKMVDFVAGVQMNKTHDNTAGANNTVKFTLKHELTRLGIQAKVSKNVWAADGDKNKTKVVITDIKLDKITDGQFYESGVYTFSTDGTKNGTWAGTAATADLNLSSLQTKATYTVGTGYNKSGIILEGTTTKSLFTSDQYLFLIPANGSTGLTDGKATVTVTYDIVTTDANLAGGCSVTHAVKTVQIPAGSLVQGKAYTLTLTINVDEVKLDAEVTDWDNATNDVTVDYSSSDVTTTTPQA